MNMSVCVVCQRDELLPWQRVAIFVCNVQCGAFVECVQLRFDKQQLVDNKRTG